MKLSYNNKIEQAYTVEEFIELGKAFDDVQYSKYAILSKAVDGVENSLIFAEHNVIYDYEEEFKSLSLTVEMTEEEYNKYKYKPKLLSFDLYGATELYFAILYINGIYNIKDFNRKTIKLIKKQDMLDLLEMIYNAEKDYIKKNRASIDYT